MDSSQPSPRGDMPAGDKPLCPGAAKRVIPATDSPSYHQVRVDFGLAPVADFGDISSDPTVQAHLQQVYPAVDDIDIWVGGLAEDQVNGGLVGETFFTIIKDQFERLRDGDRFWYQTYLPPLWVHVVERRTLATIIRENTSIDEEIQDNVFLVPQHHSHQGTSAKSWQADTTFLSW